MDGKLSNGKTENRCIKLFPNGQVISGMMQGTVLPWIMCLIYINEMLVEEGSYMSMSASNAMLW